LNAKYCALPATSLICNCFHRSSLFLKNWKLFTKNSTLIPKELDSNRRLLATNKYARDIYFSVASGSELQCLNVSLVKDAAAYCTKVRNSNLPTKLSSNMMENAQNAEKNYPCFPSMLKLNQSDNPEFEKAGTA
jgi:hypothetical protein